MTRQHIFLSAMRVAWLVFATLVLSAVSGWSQSPPTLPPGYASSPALRARLEAAAADSTIQPWRREFMLGVAGAPAWTQPSPAGTPPSARHFHTAIYDPVRDRMLVFGGENASVVNDTWALSLAGAPAWTQLSPAGTPPPARYAHTAIYDPVRDRMLVFGGKDGSSAFNDTWALSLAGAPAWTQLGFGVKPPALYGRTAIYDPVRDRMLVFGGYTAAGFHNETWALSLAGAPAWTQLSPAGTPPPARGVHTAIYDPVRDRMLVFGGYTGGDNLLNDAWELSLAGTSAWTQLAPTGTPPSAREVHAAIYDPVRDLMLVFGGYTAASVVNDTWALSLASTPAWTQLSPAGTPPPARYGHTAIYDPTRDRMLMFGGIAGIGSIDLFNDAWALGWGPVTRTITASAGAGGSITPSGVVSVAPGANQSFAIAPDACYSIGQVLVDGVPVGLVSSYTFSNVTADHTIVASFLPAASSPATPTGVATYIAQDNTAITVTWTQVPGASSYRVQRTGGSVVGPWTVADGPFPYYRDESVTEATPYSYTVSAVNSCSAVSPPSVTKSATIHYPVVFVHGICGEPAQWATWTTVFTANSLTATSAVDLRRRDNHGNPKHESANLPIATSAALLSAHIEGIVGTNTRGKVNIVAHSMGGIVARQYIEAQGGNARVNKLIMMGTPNHGSGGQRVLNQMGGYLTGVVLGNGLMTCLVWGEADDQLQINSPFMCVLNYGSKDVKDEQCPGDRGNNGPEHIAAYADRYWTIAGTGSQTGLVCQAVNQRSDTWTWDCNALEKTNDGFISLGSVHLDALATDRATPSDWRRNHNLSDIDVIGRHVYHDTQSLSLLGNCSESYQASVALATQVAHLLKGEEFDPVVPQPTPAIAAIGPSSAQSAADSLPAVDLPYVNRFQQPASVVEDPVGLPATPEVTFFCFNSRQGELAFRLRTPSGTVISESDTVGRPDLLYRNEPENGVQFFVVSNPQAGSWHLVTDASAASDSQYVGLIVQLRSSANVAALMDTVTSEGGPHLRITGMPIQSGVLVTNAAVTADVVDPLGAIRTLALLDDGAHGDGGAGDGVYGVLLPPDAGAGVYGADVRATWLQGGETVARAAPVSYGITAAVDLEVDSTGVVPSVAVPDSGSIIELSVVVRNRGGASADSAVVNWFQVGIGLIGQSTVSVPTHDSVTVSTPWRAAGGDTVYVFASVIVGPGQTETDYTNNVARSSIVLGVSVVGVEVLPAPVPTQFLVGPLHPNPARNDETHLRFAIPSPRRVDVEVYDVAGRRVRVLIQGQLLSAGEHSVVWDDRDESGQLLRSGVYLMRVRAGRDVGVRRVVVIR